MLLYSGNKWHIIQAMQDRKGVIILENLTEMLKGILEGCVLEIIGRGQTYGYEITRILNKLGFTDVVDGTAYTILVRLEKNKRNSSRSCETTAVSQMKNAEREVKLALFHR